MPSSKNRRKAARKNKRDVIRQALIDTNRDASMRRGLEAAAEKLLFVEDKTLQQPQTWEQVAQLKKQKRKIFKENFKDSLDRTRDKIMRPELTEVSVKTVYAPSKTATERHVEKLAREVEKKQQQQNTTTTTQKKKQKKALTSIWDTTEQQQQKDRDEQLLRKSFIPNVLKQKKLIPSVNDERLRKNQAKRNKKAKVVLPVSGQSYNPDPEAMKKALEVAALHESRKALKAEKIHEKLVVRDEEELAAGGDDEWDGLLARERPDEEQDPESIRQPTPKPKQKTFISQVKLKRHKIQKTIEARNQARKKAIKETGKIPKYVANAEAFYTRLNAMRELKHKVRAVRSEESRFKEEYPIQSVTDVIMPAEVTSLRNHDNHSWSLWSDRLIASHKSGLNEVDSLKRGNIRFNGLKIE
jgi:hypothetical protein